MDKPLTSHDVLKYKTFVNRFLSAFKDRVIDTSLNPSSKSYIKDGKLAGGDYMVIIHLKGMEPIKFEIYS